MNTAEEIEDKGEASLQEFTSMMENTLDKLKSQFDKYSCDILSKMEELGNRMDEMEKTIGDLTVEPTQDSMEDSALNAIEST